MNSINEFLSALCKNKLANAVMEEFLHEWGDDYPTTLLFSALGKAIATNFGRFKEDEKARLFSVVEDGMKCSDVVLRTHVATGLLEALYNRSQVLENWSVLSKSLGIASTCYLDEWTKS